MILLPLTTPMPATRNPDSPMAQLPEGADFVDESVVLRVIAGPTCRRGPLDPDETFLAADDLDFAGWRPVRPAAAITATPAPQAAVPVVPPPRRTAPPPPRQAAAHRVGGGWLSVVTGLFCGVLFGIALLSQHQLVPPAAKWLPSQAPAAPESAATVIPQAVTSTDARTR